MSTRIVIDEFDAKNPAAPELLIFFKIILVSNA